MLWIKTVFVRRDAPASRKRVGRIFAAGAAVTAGLTAPAFTADLAAPPPALTWTGVYLGANASAWFAPANPRYDAIGFPSGGFDLVPNGGREKAGFSGGFQAGYNYQTGSLVPGFQTDFNTLGNCRNGGFAAPPAYAPSGIGSSNLSGGCSHYFGTMRGRQTIGLGGGTEQFEAGANQLAGPVA